MSKTALLVIDVQTGFTDGDPAVFDAPGMLARIHSLIAHARTADVPVIFVRHVEALEYDGPLHPTLDMQPGDPVIDKLTPDSFYETTLQETLQGLGVESLVLAGFQTEYCIDTTARRAFSQGYRVTLVADAHSTFPGETLTAEQIIAHHTGVLRGFAAVKPIAKISFE